MKKRTQSPAKSLETLNHNSTDLLALIRTEIPLMRQAMESVKQELESMNKNLFRVIWALIALVAGAFGIKLFV